MISDATIKSALRSAPTSGKTVIELKDGGARGSGRLALLIRVAPGRLTTEWYAVWYRGGKRKMAKIGTYPDISVADARVDFRETYLPAITRGQDPTGPRARQERRGDTVTDLFTAYCDSLEAKGKSALNQRRFLLGAEKKSKRWSFKAKSAAESIGPTKRAAEVTKDDIKPLLREIHERGAATQANSGRGHLHAAFNYGLFSANSFHEAGGQDWGLTVNPVAAIPSNPEAKKVGQRHLKPGEFRDFWLWLQAKAPEQPGAAAVMLIMGTGQRPGEILKLTDASYDEPEQLLDWGKTKNGCPHTAPLPRQCAGILGGLTPRPTGHFFVQFAGTRKERQMHVTHVEYICGLYLEENPSIAKFTPRDLRRTWKTLAGAAGVSKEIRDRLQNHSRSDVSSKHYDRYEYLPEKRAGMKQWEGYLDRIIAGDLDTPVTRLPAAAAR